MSHIYHLLVPTCTYVCKQSDIKMNQSQCSLIVYMLISMVNTHYQCIHKCITNYKLNKLIESLIPNIHQIQISHICCITCKNKVIFKRCNNLLCLEHCGHDLWINNVLLWCINFKTHIWYTTNVYIVLDIPTTKYYMCNEYPGRGK